MRRFVAFVSTLLLALAFAVPAHADAPERFDVPFFSTFPDQDNGYVVFWNITRANYCAWEASGFEGEPPVIEPVTVQVVATRQGALIGSLQAERPVELWPLDADVPPLIGPCQDSDDAEAAWATGSVRISAHDNDLDVSLTRTNVFGQTGTGTVSDSSGSAWHYSWRTLDQISRMGEFSGVVFGFTLKQKGR